MNIQSWFPLKLIWSPCSPRDSQESSPAPRFKNISSLVLSLLYGPTLTSVHDFWKNHSFDYTDLCWQSDVFAFYLSRFVITFLPRSNLLLISWLQSPSAVILEPKKIKSVTVSMWSCIYFSATLNSSYLLLPPQGEVLCVHKSVLGACSCPGNRIINTIFIDSIYMHSYMIFVFLIYFTLYDSL